MGRGIWSMRDYVKRVEDRKTDRKKPRRFIDLRQDFHSPYDYSRDASETTFKSACLLQYSQR